MCGITANSTYSSPVRMLLVERWTIQSLVYFDLLVLVPSVGPLVGYIVLIEGWPLTTPAGEWTSLVSKLLPDFDQPLYEVDWLYCVTTYHPAIHAVMLNHSTTSRLLTVAYSWKFALFIYILASRAFRPHAQRLPFYWTKELEYNDYTSWDKHHIIIDHSSPRNEHQNCRQTITIANFHWFAMLFFQPGFLLLIFCEGETQNAIEGPDIRSSPKFKLCSVF